jgi:hypothetical protein
MSRKPIPDQTQTNIFLNSRRRCCLCFWLKGEDEVKKGQIAHLDGDNANSAEGNLAFLCFEHHDEYDSTTRQSKGLKPTEVKRWRDELYREMRYRFRSLKTKAAELSLVGFQWRGTGPFYFAHLSIKNTGEAELRHIVVSIRLPDLVGGQVPPERPYQTGSGPLAMTISPMPVMWGAEEDRQDLFEPNGRVCRKAFPPFAVVMPDHAERFDALRFHTKTTPLGSGLTLDYRIDAEDMAPALGRIEATIPSDRAGFFRDIGD